MPANLPILEGTCIPIILLQINIKLYFQLTEYVVSKMRKLFDGVNRVDLIRVQLIPIGEDAT
jgi:hypothetical protein